MSGPVPPRGREMKIWWACRVDPAERHRQLAELATKYGLKREAEFWGTSERAVR
jgi:hypothetical protein